MGTEKEVPKRRQQREVVCVWERDREKNGDWKVQPDEMKFISSCCMFRFRDDFMRSFAFIAWLQFFFRFCHHHTHDSLTVCVLCYIITSNLFVNFVKCLSLSLSFSPIRQWSNVKRVNSLGLATIWSVDFWWVFSVFSNCML